MTPVLPHAVSRLRTARLARSSKPFLARGGPRGERCAGCRLVHSHCLCALRLSVPTRAGVCLLMADIESLKPSNTGWLVADVVADTFAFGWARTTTDPELLALLADPQWQPVVVFPGEFVAPDRVVTELPTDDSHGKRPLFVLLDATWPEARKMFRKSPCLDQLPVLSLQAEQISRYQLRRSRRDDHFCTSEVAALCMDLAGEPLAARTLEAYLDVFTAHYLQARNQLPVDLGDAVHQRLNALHLLQRQASRLGATILTPPRPATRNPDARPVHTSLNAAMTSDLKPTTDSNKMALCDSCAGIQRNWRKAPGHPELVQGNNRHETRRHGLIAITSYRCDRCGTAWEYENDKTNLHAGWSVVGR